MAKFEKGGLTDGAGSEWDEEEHPRNENGEFISISEFRYLENHPDPKIAGHPAHLYAKKDDDVKYIQMTHSRSIKGNPKENIKMQHNPNPKDERDSYFVPKSANGKMA